MSFFNKNKIQKGKKLNNLYSKNQKAIDILIKYQVKNFLKFYFKLMIHKIFL